VINSPARSLPVVVCESSGVLEVVELGRTVGPTAVVLCGPVVDDDVVVPAEPQAHKKQARATATVVNCRPGPNPFMLKVYVGWCSRGLEARADPSMAAGALAIGVLGDCWR
jgi:hypothetical protein